MEEKLYTLKFTKEQLAIIGGTLDIVSEESPEMTINTNYYGNFRSHDDQVPVSDLKNEIEAIDRMITKAYQEQ